MVSVNGAAKGSEQYRLLVVGLGGGGCNAVGRFTAHWGEGPDVVAINTDAQALEACGIPHRIQIGTSLTKGLGTGGDMAIGKLAAEEDTEVLRELLAGVNMVFLVATLGGGTGTGAVPIVGRVARESGALVICFVTLPFEFEGEKRKRQADEGLRAIKMHADAVICLPNERIRDLVQEESSLLSAFGKVDEMMGIGIRTVWQLLMRAGLINLDFSDLRNLVENSGGTCVFGCGEGSGPGKSDEAIESALRHPLLERGELLKRTGAVMVNITGGPDLTLAEVRKVMDRVNEGLRAGARVFMGATIENSWRDRLAITILAAENWQEPDYFEDLRAPADATETPAGETATPTRSTASTSRTRTRREVQPSLNFDSTDKGRFKGVDPTLYQGEDLDIPTFIRRGIKLSTDR